MDEDIKRFLAWWDAHKDQRGLKVVDGCIVGHRPACIHSDPACCPDIFQLDDLADTLRELMK